MVYDPANPPAAPAADAAAAPKLVQQEVVSVGRKAEDGDAPAEAPGEGAEGGQKAAGKAPGAAAKATSQSIRVDVERLDDLVNVVGEIVIGNTRLSQLGQALGIRYDRDTTVQNLNEALGQLARLVGDLQMTVMRTRMIPVERVFNRFPRLVRDLSRMLGKEVKLELYGQETEIDKTVSEELEDPLVHLMRNAVDHGVERPDVREGAGKSRIGTVKMSAHHEGSYIVIVLEDDGGGIDPQKVLKKAREQGLAQPDYNYSENEILQFIFAPGFSTAEKITDVSGRGVGMDVVNQNIRKIKGSITVQSAKGIGTKFIIKLPLTLAITKALLVRSGGETYAIPLDAVRESIRLSQNEIKTINGRPVTQNRAEVLPLYNLSDAFGFTNHDESLNGGYMPVVVVGGEKHQLGLIVDRLEGEQDVVVKSMGSYLKDIRGVAGATILGDGRVALILDIATLIDESGLDDRSFDRHQAGQRA
jgi:two-component system chemotaxis sensor kinase CheA